MSIHVTPKEGKWQVKKSNGEKAFRVVDTQEEAIGIAKDVAKNQGTDVKIHSARGHVRAGMNYSNAKKAASPAAKALSPKEQKQKDKADKKAAKQKAKADKKAAKQAKKAKK